MSALGQKQTFSTAIGCKNAAIVAGDELGKIVFSGAKVRKLSMQTHLVPLAAFCSYSLPRRPKIIAHSLPD
jgi:hypothetical protein